VRNTPAFYSQHCYIVLKILFSVYVDDNTLIPKNTSLLVARVPLAQQPKKQWEGSNSGTSVQHKDAVLNKGLADLSRMEGSEQDKINAMISQSTFDYDPSK
jgi:E3 ubiquitin-protein ligase RBBP6